MRAGRRQGWYETLVKLERFLQEEGS